MPHTLRIAVLLGALAAATPGFAQECPTGSFCATVRQDVAPGGNVYRTIQAAVNSGNNLIFIYPGVYPENLTVASGVTLKAIDGPLFTCLQASPGSPAVDVSQGTRGVKLIGLSILGGSRGVNVQNTADVTVSNCIIDGAGSAGVYSFWDEEGNPLTSLTLVNSVVRNTQNGSGLVMADTTTLRDIGYNAFGHDLVVRNNIITNNSSYGIYAETPCCGFRYQNVDKVLISNNYILGNLTGQLGPGINVANGFVASDTISTGPTGFLGTAIGCGFDARLAANSQLIDRGVTDVSFRDPDGTRNDIGPYGGPDSAGFFVSPTDGPVVREILVPAVVQRGDTVTIQATGAVR